MLHECHESEYSKFLKSLGIDKEKMLADMESRLPEDKRNRLRKMRLERIEELEKENAELKAQFWGASPSMMKALAKAYIAGATENGIQWHDLRKNPTDLPKEVGYYIVCFLDTYGERHTFELSFVDYFEDKHWIDEDNHNIEGYDEGVIAWCELPKYTEE